jgi:hypothetical protein
MVMDYEDRTEGTVLESHDYCPTGCMEFTMIQGSFEERIGARWWHYHYTETVPERAVRRAERMAEILTLRKRRQPMSEIHDFCDTCPDCRPAILDVNTGQRLAAGHPVFDAVMRVWDNDTSYEERRAFITVTTNKPYGAAEEKLFDQLNNKFRAALDHIKKEELP